jgi:glyoxylase-like metal-dependent hydrolase (beta-lactamase superfamily II)
MADTLNLQTFSLGPWQTNCYVISVAGQADCWIVDAGFEPAPMLDWIARANLTPSRLILTHGHLDHIAGIVDVTDRWPDIDVLIHPAERDFLTDPALNLSIMIDEPITAPPATGSIEHGQTLDFHGHLFEVRHTPGHSPGGVTLYCAAEKLAIVGDTLFAGSIGRYDFPTSNGPTLMRSIREQLLTLPDDTAIHPGHGPASTIGDERQSNPFL